MNTSSDNKQGTSVIAGLGLGISIFVLLFILLINLLLFNSQEAFDFKVSIYMILLIVGGLLGLLGFIFSLVGLIMAIKHYTPKWIGTCGIVISCLSFVCFFTLPLLFTTSIVKEPTEVIVPPSILEKDDCDSNKVVIQINEAGSVTCYVGEYGVSSLSHNDINLNDDNSKKQFTSWLKDNLENVDDNTPITLVASSKTDYSDINLVMDWLQECGHSRFTLKTNEEN